MALHTIDPELLLDDRFTFLPVEVKFLYVAMIAQADDQGRLFAHRQLMRSRTYLADKSLSRGLDEWIKTLHDAGFIILYENDGREYIQISDWWRQQTNNRPRPSRWPAPPDWQDKVGYVYLLHDGEFYKIGMSGQPDKRLAQLQYQDGREYTIVALIPTEDNRRLEKELHKRFHSKRVKGEWFSLAPEDIAWITALAGTEEEE